jgi:hypothetical protein
VFFVTADRLVPRDIDSRRDVYDARVGGGFPAPRVLPPVCEGEACQGPLAAPPIFGAPASATFSGPGNLPPPLTPKAKAKLLTGAQKLARALKACRAKPKHRRVACERQARKRYGAKKASTRARDRR